MTNLRIIVSRVVVVETGLILLLPGEKMVGQRRVDRPPVVAEGVVGAFRLAGAAAVPGGQDGGAQMVPMQVVQVVMALVRLAHGYALPAEACPELAEG